MPLLPPGAGQSVPYQSAQDYRLNQQLMQAQQLQIEQARQAQARDLQMRQNFAIGIQPPAPQPPQPGQPSVPMTHEPQGAQSLSAPMGTQGMGGMQQIPPYRTVESASQPPTPAQGPMAPPQIQEPKTPEQIASNNMLGTFINNLKAAGVPQDQWYDAIKGYEPIMTATDRTQFQLMTAQIRAQEAATHAYAAAMNASQGQQRIDVAADKQASAAPKTRTVQQGSQSVTQEWDPTAKQWNTVGVGAKWKAPSSGGAGGGASSKYDPAFLDYYAKRAAVGDYTWRPNMKRDMVSAVEARVPAIAQNMGIEPTDAIAMGGELKASTGALGAVTKDLAAIRPFKDMLDTNANIAVDLSRKVLSTNSKLANKSLNWIKQNAGDNPDTAEFLAQVAFVQTEAARVLNNPRLTGQLTDTAREEMQHVVDGNMPLNSFERVIKRIQNDGNNRVAAMEKERSSLQSNLQNPMGKVSKSKSFSSQAELEAAVKRGEVKKGDKVTVNGVSGSWQ